MRTKQSLAAAAPAANMMGEACSVSLQRTLESLNAQLNLLGRTLDLMRGVTHADCETPGVAKFLGLVGKKAATVSLMSGKDAAVARKALAQALRLTKACLAAVSLQEEEHQGNMSRLRQGLFLSTQDSRTWPFSRH